MDYQFLNIERHGQVEVLKLNDPTALNAISPPMLDEMRAELNRVEDDPSVRVLILTGEGRSFCAGANIKRMYARVQGDKDVPISERPEPMRQLTPHLVHSRRVVYTLWKMSKTTIAAINGPCITTGVGFSAACDIRIASDQARFGWLFLRRGLPPDDGSLPLMVRLLGYDKAYKLGILGEIISAQDALNIGFLEQVVSHDQLIPTCMELASKIITNVPHMAQRMFKRLAQAAMYDSYEYTSLLEGQAYNVLTDDPDHAEAVRAFIEKRQPVWSGS